MLCTKSSHSAVALLLAGIALALLTGCPPQGPSEQPAGPDQKPLGTSTQQPRPPDFVEVWPMKAVWVVRTKYQSPQQIATVMDRIKAAGLNTVFFQVRGNGTSYYRSAIEPWAEEYGGDPGFDPLTVAVDEAHRRGLAIHAWVNVMPGWHGPRPPADPQQLYNAHPEWFWYDQNGKREPLPETFYVSLNPCLPEVRSYLVGVFRDILTRYNLDGLHLDYIRFPIDEAPKGSDYPYDARTLQLYRKATWKKPSQDKARWNRWRTDQVTQLVRDIRWMVKRTRPRARLTVACAPDLAHARNDCFQDGPTWARQALVDVIYVMNYTKNTDLYRKRQETWRKAAPGKHIAPGIGIYMHDDPANTMEQLRLSEQWGSGFGLFSYEAICGHGQRARQRLAAIGPTLSQMK